MLTNIIRAKISDMETEYETFRQNHRIDMLFMWFAIYNQPIIKYFYLRFLLKICLVLKRITDNEKFKTVRDHIIYYVLMTFPLVSLFLIIAFKLSKK